MGEATITPEERAALRALREKATPGPWMFWHGDDSSCMNCYGVTAGPCDHEYVDEGGHAGHVIALTLLQEPRLASMTSDGGRWQENTQLIVAAVNALPGLLDALDAAERREREAFRRGAEAMREAVVTAFTPLVGNDPGVWTVDDQTDGELVIEVLTTIIALPVPEDTPRG